MNPVPAEIHEDILEESICKLLSLTEVNVVPAALQLRHCMKKWDRVIAKFKYRKQNQENHGKIHTTFHVTDIKNLLEIDNLAEYINNASC